MTDQPPPLDQFTDDALQHRIRDLMQEMAPLQGVGVQAMLQAAPVLAVKRKNEVTLDGRQQPPRGSNPPGRR